MRTRNITVSVIVIAVLLFFIYDYFFSQTSIEQRIIEQKDYHLELLADDVSIKFAFQPEWLKLELNKPKKLMQRICQTGDSETYIEEVVRQDERICVALLIKSQYKFRQGDFLFVETINPNGTITSSENGQWHILKNGKELDPLRCSFGYGSGPGSRISIFLDIDRAKDFDDSIQIMYEGLQKYEYKRI
ncbi:MAG: hypothetical protein CVU89_01855 [Firmicutes bacterium HGW-Firmicutes-14]|nr:MAG: hypothetical protein CVU89_01855 [Firmicutes bacterium HGW-Firmicutes-14]